MLKQDQYAPVNIERQVVSIFLGTNGYLDTIAVADVKRFEKEVLEYFEIKHNDIFETIKKEKDLSPELIEKIKKAADEFILSFKRSV